MHGLFCLSVCFLIFFICSDLSLCSFLLSSAYFLVRVGFFLSVALLLVLAVKV